MRLIVAGSDDFALPSLAAVLEAGHEVCAVLTAPDRPGDRGRSAPRPLRDLAVARGLLVLQPPRLRDPAAVRAALATGAELLVVAAYGQLVPMALLDRLARGGVGVHPSLLPRHRGAAPIQAAILAGDAVTGVSLMRMERGLDTGPVLARRPVPLPPDVTAPELRRRLAGLGADLLVEVLARMGAGGVAGTPQDERMATYAPALRRGDGDLDWDRPAVAVDRALRALQPWPQVTVPLAGLRVRLLAGGLVEGRPRLGDAAPGRVLAVEGEAALVGTARGLFRVERVQPPSRRPMTAAAYLRGRRVRPASLASR